MDQQKLIVAACNNNPDLIAEELAKPEVMSGHNQKQRNTALRFAAEMGNLECVKLLLPVSDPKAYDNRALRLAAENGHSAVVKMLIPVSDPKVDSSAALIWAAEYGHLECVQLLLPHSDPKAHNSNALVRAAQNGHTQVVRTLIPVSDPLVENSVALQLAVEHGHEECVDLLYPVSDTDKVLRVFQENFAAHPQIWESLRARKCAEQQHAQLTKTLGLKQHRSPKPHYSPTPRKI